MYSASVGRTATMRAFIVVRTVTPSSSPMSWAWSSTPAWLWNAPPSARVIEVAALLRVDEQDAIAGAEGSGHG